MADLELTATASIPSGASVTLTVYEDTSGDGSADNSVSQSLNDGTDTYTFSGFDGSAGTDYWVDGSISSGDEDAVTVSSIETTALGTISGTVLDEGNSVEDAVVIVLNTEQIDHSDPVSVATDDVELAAVATTNANGDWSATVPANDEMHAVVEWKGGATLGNALSKPFL